MPRPLPIPTRRTGEPPAGYLRWHEAARRSGIASARLERLVRLGVIPALRIGAQTWVDGEAIARYQGAVSLPGAAPTLPAPAALPESAYVDHPGQAIDDYAERLAIRAVVELHERALVDALRQARIVAGLEHQLDQARYRRELAEERAVRLGCRVGLMAKAYGAAQIAAIRQEIRPGSTEVGSRLMLADPTAPGEAGDVRDCLFCGISFVLVASSGAWRHRVYCSDRCRKRAYAARKRSA